MPELPEVETVRKVLLPIVKDRRILSIDVKRKQTIISGSDEFVKALTNQTFIDITRIGKYLIFHLTNGLVFLSHLRMEGKYFEYLENEEDGIHARVVFHLDNNHKLVYDDSRCFGIMKLSNEDQYLKEKELSSLGKEPFYIDDVTPLINRCKNNKGPIKATLLDQTLLTGLGNIYADEVLFKSKINPNKITNTLTKDEWETILDNSKSTLTEAIKAGGSTIRSYHPGKNIDGEFQLSLLCYGKKNERCPRCSSLFHFTRVGGRGTTYCPFCQKEMKDKYLIGITGKIASGKSSVLNTIKMMGYSTISCDDVVSELYQNNRKLKREIEKLIGFTFSTPYANKDELRPILVNDKSLIKQLNKIVHPYVIDYVNKWVKKHDEQFLFIEVPLMFESGMDKMMDFIIGVDIDRLIQIERLEKRNITSSKQLDLIGMNNSFDKHLNNIDFIINNNSDLSNLESEVQTVINKLKSLRN